VKIKLAENIHGDVVELLQAQGHEVATVHDEKLAGRPDADVAAAIQAEATCAITER
jgi:hypothetical protein